MDEQKEDSGALTTRDRYYVIICFLALIDASYFFRDFALHVQAGSAREAQALTAFAFHEQFFDESAEKYIVDSIPVIPWHVESILIPNGLSGLLDRLDALSDDEATEEEVVIPDNVIQLFPEKSPRTDEPPDESPPVD